MGVIVTKPTIYAFEKDGQEIGQDIDKKIYKDLILKIIWLDFPNYEGNGYELRLGF